MVILILNVFVHKNVICTPLIIFTIINRCHRFSYLTFVVTWDQVLFDIYKKLVSRKRDREEDGEALVKLSINRWYDYII